MHASFSYCISVFMTHPASWDGTADVRLVSKILISDVVFRADQNSTRPVRTTRDWTEKEHLVECVSHYDKNESSWNSGAGWALVSNPFVSFYYFSV